MPDDRKDAALQIDPHTRKVSRYLASVASMPDEETLLRDGVALAVDAVGGHAGAFVRDGETIEGVRCDTHADVVEVDAEPAGTLIVCRDRAFEQEEERLVRAIARVLTLTLATMHTARRERAHREEDRGREKTNARQLAELLERQSLFERLGKIQRAIARANSLREVGRAIIDGLKRLYGDELASVRVLDDDDDRFTVLIGSMGIRHDLERRVARLPVARTAGANAMTNDVLVAGKGSGSPEFGDVAFASMAAPIHVDGTVAGCVVVATHRADRVFTRSEREVFLALCESVGIAIGDARTRERSLERALHDTLTGLPNRVLFSDRLRHSLASARRTGAGIGVLCIDIDRFKIINDGFGHAAGDEVLQEVGDRIRACLRAGDTAARFGGDEFGILVEDAHTEADVIPVAERVLHSLRAPFIVDDREVSLGASIGIALATPQLTADETLRNAAVALHEAKASGRETVAIFEPDMHERLLARVELQSDLQRSLAEEQFVVHYQPLVSLDTGAIKGFEALVRWNHPRRGLLMPDNFVPLAEELGLVSAIDRWVLNRACADLRAWQALPGCAGLTVSVNLSARDFRKPGLEPAVSEAIVGLPANSLVLEITESALLESDALIGALTDLRARGVRIAVDDFGTGYSSLSYLNRFPVDVLKIDKSFIASIANGPDESALARAVLRIGAALGVETVAEGVEDERQRAVLLELGCMTAQGFLFSEGVSAAEVPTLLEQHGTRHLRSAG